MRIKKYVHFEDEIDIDLTAEDLRGFIDGIEEDEKENRYIIHSQITKAVLLLQNIPEKFMKDIKDIVVGNLKKCLETWEKV